MGKRWLAALLFGAGILVGRPLAAEESSGWEGRAVRLPPLLWYERDPAEDRRFLMVSLLYWDMAQGRSYQRLFVPFFFRFKNDAAAQTYLPPLYLQRTTLSGGRVTTALPILLYDYRNRDRSRIDQAFPLGFRRVRGDARKGWLLNYGWSVSPDRRSHALVPLFWRDRSPGRAFDLWGPFYRVAVGGRDDVPERRYAGVFPLWGAGGTTASPSVRSSFLIPFYYHERAPGRSVLLTLPASRAALGERRWGHIGLYYRARGPRRRTDGIFPLWSRTATTDGAERGLQLLNFIDQRRSDRRFQTVFPLYGHWANADGSRFLSWLYCRRRAVRRDADGRPAGEDIRGWSLLYTWARRPGGDSTDVAFPVYWRYRRPGRWSLDLAFPLFGRYRDPHTTITAGLPFLHARSDEQETWSFLYLYWRDRQKERRRDVLFPLAFYDRSPGKRNFVSPLFWTRRGPLSREGAWPLGHWYKSAEKSRRLVLPLYYNAAAANRRLTIFGPYYRVARTSLDGWGVFPLWGWTRPHPGSPGASPPRREPPVPRDDFDLNFLLLGHVARHGDERTHGFYPLYRSVRRGDFKNFWAPRGLPLVAWRREERRRDGWVFPFAWHRSPERAWELFLPLWYGSRQSQPVAGASAERGKTKESTQVLFPLYWRGRSPERRYTTLFPLYAEGRDSQSRYRVAAPLWWSFDTPRGGAFRLFFPLYWRATFSGEGKDNKVVRVYGPWYSVVTQKGDASERTVGLAPLFSKTAGVPGEGEFDVLGGLFARETHGHARRFRWLWLFTTRPRPGNPARSESIAE